MDKKSVKEQFGAHARTYITSRPHAKGASLQRLVELVEPQPDWQALDIATAAGHTAFAFAPHVAHVHATDITPQMLTVAREQVAARGVDNVTVEHADAENLPYVDNRFDLLTCRIAPHHFPAVDAFLRESVRVLRPGGILAVVDNVVPEGVAGDYVNAFEKLRDPSHGRCLSVEEWLEGYAQVGLELTQNEILEKQMVFEDWAARHDQAMQSYLRALLFHGPPQTHEFLHPRSEDGRTLFHLREGLFIGRIHH
ncbi:MAG: methyltransferase domain-containing protein [Caldilineaceae bacterium SB0668_bin_21]|nr:methyltransferase domain-containing protein [Caldilineaceae bacterium SB0668_bin_21]MYC23575.1 methyltransferase domain-containing protein [Caldilineaceae bacterium SB0662_bin_25]